MKLRSNASIISTAHQYELKSSDNIYNFFVSIVSNVGAIGKFDLTNDYRSTTEFYHENNDIFKSATRFIRDFDLGISEIQIKSNTDESGKTYYFPVFIHDAKVKENFLVFHNESLGTQTLYKLLPHFLNTIKCGGILVIDEFDTDFHPHMLKLLVELFDRDDINKNNSQLIFSTHNTEIIDYLSKYRTVLVNKKSSESYLYRLDEIQGDIIRNDRPISPVYNSGKIGGVPNI